MLLADACLPPFYSYYGLSYTPHQVEERPSLRYVDYRERARAGLKQAGLELSPLHYLYATLPALLPDSPHETDPQMLQFVNEFLAGYKDSPLPFYLITIAIKNLERRLFAEVPYREPSLDLGIGDGYASNLVHRSQVTIGSEPLIWGLLEAKKYHRHRELMAIDMTALPFEDASFNTCLLVHSIDHIGDRTPALEEVARVLRPGGVVALSDACYLAPGFIKAASPHALLGNTMPEDACDYLLDIGGENDEFWTPERYQTILSGLGFEDISIEFFMSPELAKICYHQFGVHLALTEFGEFGDHMRKNAPLREYFFNQVREKIVPLMSADRELSKGGGFNFFITARKPGAQTEAPDIMQRVACPVCKVKLNNYACPSCAREYPVFEGMPLLCDFYADAWKDIKTQPMGFKQKLKKFPLAVKAVRMVRKIV